jgi:hypothetical protein
VGAKENVCPAVPAHVPVIEESFYAQLQSCMSAAIILLCADHLSLHWLVPVTGSKIVVWRRLTSQMHAIQPLLNGTIHFICRVLFQSKRAHHLKKRYQELTNTPSGLLNEVVLDMISVKH